MKFEGRQLKLYRKYDLCMLLIDRKQRNNGRKMAGNRAGTCSQKLSNYNIRSRKHWNNIWMLRPNWLSDWSTRCGLYLFRNVCDNRSCPVYYIVPQPTSRMSPVHSLLLCIIYHPFRLAHGCKRLAESVASAVRRHSGQDILLTERFSGLCLKGSQW